MNDIVVDYLFVKQLHLACVVLSISLFVLRGVLQWQSKPWRQCRLLRVAPHVVDSVLLGSALWLAWRIGQYPFVHGWLTAKVLALLAYILLGHRSLRKIKAYPFSSTTATAATRGQRHRGVGSWRDALTAASSCEDRRHVLLARFHSDLAASAVELNG